MAEPISPETIVDDDDEPVPAPEPDEDETAEHEEAEHEQAASEQEDAPEAIDPKAIERIFQKLDGEAARHAKRLGEIMDEDAQDLLLCPMCAPIEGMPNTPGFVLNAPIHPVAAERTRDALGIATRANLKKSPFSDPCDVCDAEGVLDTGSHVSGFEIEMCQKCQQRGYVPKGTLAGVTQLQTPNGTEDAAATPVPTALGPEPPEAAALRARGYAVIAPPPPMSQ